jgi:hypothetical protein
MCCVHPYLGIGTLYGPARTQKEIIKINRHPTSARNLVNHFGDFRKRKSLK